MWSAIRMLVAGFLLYFYGLSYDIMMVEYMNNTSGSFAMTCT